MSIPIGHATCGYCKRILRSAVVIYPGAKPSCGNAQCILQAMHDSEKDD